MAKSVGNARTCGRSLIFCLSLLIKTSLLSASSISILSEDPQIRSESTTSSKSYEVGEWRPIPPEGLALIPVGVVLQASRGRYVGLSSTFDRTGGGAELTRPLGEPQIFSKVVPEDVQPEIVRSLQATQSNQRSYSPGLEAALTSDYCVDISDQRFRISRAGGPTIVDATLEQFLQLRPSHGRRLLARVVFDEIGKRFVVVAFESFDSTEESAGPKLFNIIWAVSDDAEPLGDWYLAEIPTFTRSGGMTHGAFAGLTGDPSGVVAWAQFREQDGEDGALETMVWILVRGKGQEGIYDGRRALVRVFGD